MFDQFPEVLLLDATHGTNISNYKLFSFMVHDSFGKGQYVQVCGHNSTLKYVHGD